MNKIKNTAIGFTIVFGVISSVYGAYSFFHRKIVEEERKNQREIVLDQKVDRLIRSDSIAILQFNHVLDTLNVVTLKQSQQIKQQRILNSSFREHLKSSKKIDELIKYYELQ